MTRRLIDSAKTAEQVAAELEADSSYRKMRDKKQALAAAAQAAMGEAEAPLVRALNDVGVEVTSVWDLVNTAAPYPSAIPVLLEHLQHNYPPQVREGIARSLAVTEASWAWDVLLSLFSREPAGGRPNVRWALACALSAAATDDVIDRVIELVRDPSVGEDRLILLHALVRSKKALATQVLEDLRGDPQLAREIRVLLGRPRRNR